MATRSSRNQGESTPEETEYGQIRRQSGSGDWREQRDWVGDGQTLSGRGRQGSDLGTQQEDSDEAVKSIGNGVVAVQADVTSLPELDKLYTQVAEKFGKFDVLFVNAGRRKICASGRNFRSALRRAIRHQHQGSLLHHSEGASLPQ